MRGGSDGDKDEADKEGLGQLFDEDDKENNGDLDYDNSAPVVSQGLEFVLNSDQQSYSVTGIGECRDVNLVIPSEYQGLPVTEIASAAFKYTNGLKIESVIIPDSVTVIGAYAFSQSSKLASVTIADSVTVIEQNAFEYCPLLTSIVIPSGVTEIEHSAFKNCIKLSSVTISDNVQTISARAFENCDALEQIVIPAGVTYINGLAFTDCDNLSSVVITNTDGWVTEDYREEPLDVSDPADVANMLKQGDGMKRS